jgi:type IV secretory pathway TrbF-like protein
MLTTALEYKLNAMTISDHITEVRNEIIDDMITRRELSLHYEWAIEKCLENFDEIVSECKPQDRAIVEKI